MTPDDENRVREIASEVMLQRSPALLNFAATQALTSLSRSTIERLVLARDFPQPVRISEARCAFVRDEVAEWIRGRIAARGGR